MNLRARINDTFHFFHQYFTEKRFQNANYPQQIVFLCENCQKPDQIPSKTVHSRGKTLKILLINLYLPKEIQNYCFSYPLGQFRTHQKIFIKISFVFRESLWESFHLHFYWRGYTRVSKNIFTISKKKKRKEIYIFRNFPINFHQFMGTKWKIYFE